MSSTAAEVPPTTTATATAVPPTAVPTFPRRRPPWLSMAGAPAEPSYTLFRQRMGQQAEEKRRLIHEAQQLRASLGPKEGKEEADRERDELRQRLNDIDVQRKAEQDLRYKKNEEIQKLQRTHDECAAKLRELSDELAGFKSIKEIDDAIAHVTRKMETSGGGLAAEKRTVQHLARLEEAKKFLLELQPLSEAIAETKHREAVLQHEWREINERVRSLHGEYNEQIQARRQRDAENRNTGVNRQEVYKKCDAISAKIAAINETMNKERAEHNAAAAAWEKWKEEARTKYMAKMEAERKERQRKIMERRFASRLEEKRTRAARRMNPYEMEITACATLTHYLRDQKQMVQREEAERERRAAAAAFDPTSHLPAGAVVLNNGKKTSENAKKPQKQQQKNKQQQQDKEADKGKEKEKEKQPRNRVLQHSEEKVRMFQLINEEPPMALAAIDDTVAKITAKQKSYESHIRTGELELSSDEDEEVEEQEQKSQENKEKDNDEKVKKDNEQEGEK